MPTAVIRLHADAAGAARVSAVLEDTLPLDEMTVSSFEDPADESRWTVEVYGGPNVGTGHLETAVRAALGPDAAAFELQREELGDADWVAASLEGLDPVRAGRFFVHGGHDAHRVPANAHAIRVEAALAFGTGHHGTTLGCLLALDSLLKLRRPAAILDLGTGTGVLAMAAAMATRGPVLASDIDPVSVTITRENARLNRVAHLVDVVEATGFDAPQIRARGPYDLILANILAAPLIALAPDMARHAAPRATLILSGLLNAQERAVAGAYLARGFHLGGRRRISGWSTLTLLRG